MYWNPIFGYYLGKYFYASLKSLFPASIALLLTFLFSGLMHDVATILVKGSTRFLFSICFFFLGAGVMLDGIVRIDLSNRNKRVRILCNLGYLLISFALAYSAVIALSFI